MAVYKRTINFLPEESEEELLEREKLSNTGLYAAALPVIAAVIWIIALLVGSSYIREGRRLDVSITEKQSEIFSYNPIREKQTELVLKVESLQDVIQKDFYPQKFFNDVSETIKSTGDAQAEVYSYSREEDGMFKIQGKAHSYLDLAKIMVVFIGKDEFSDVQIESIRYNREEDNVNFEISFMYADTGKQAS